MTGNDAIAKGKTIGSAVRTAGPWGVALLALAVTGLFAWRVSEIPAARADPFTGTQAREMEARLQRHIDTGLASIQSDRDRRWTEHTATLHPGVEARIARLEAQYETIRELLTEIRKDIRDMRNGDGGPR